MKETEVATEGLLQYLNENGKAFPAREELVKNVSERFGISLSEAASIISFYSEMNGLPKESVTNALLRVKGKLLSNNKDVWTAVEMVENAPEKTLSKISASGLTGRGGAAFSTATKWESVRNSEAERKIIICNVSEGEPGTCKDYALLSNVPENVIAGMSICAKITGAKTAYVYIRSGYEAVAEKVRQSIKDNQKKLDDLKINVVENYGSYVCGEETALISSLEGRRGEPRKKPPYPVQSGFCNCPTIINNAETFANIPLILSCGPEEFRKTETRIFTVTGSQSLEGIYELPVSSSIGDIISASGAVKVKAVLLGGGASGVFVPENIWNVPLDSLEFREQIASIGTVSIRFVNESESIKDICSEVVDFFSNESCGKCTPCRFGTRKLSSLIKASCFNKAELLELINYLRTSCFCALGKSSVNAVYSALQNYPQEFLGEDRNE